MKTVVVVPTIREQSIQRFLAAWDNELSQAHIIIVEDNPEPTFDLGLSSHVTHYAWTDIDRELGDASWIIPRRTDCVRSYGYYKAYQTQPDLIITLDDDCYPDPAHPNFVEQHWSRIQAGGDMDAWQSSGAGTLPRGIPYYARSRQWPCVLNHGLWTQIPDFDAPTQLLQGRAGGEYIPLQQTIPVGRYFPMCGMNVAFLPLVTPALYFLLMGRSWEYDRFGDIWAGIVVKRICDHLGYAVNSGPPHIEHQRASNVWDNLRKEAPGLRANEEFWAVVDRIRLRGDNFRDCYIEIAEQLQLPGDYWTQLRQAMRLWADLFPAV